MLLLPFEEFFPASGRVWVIILTLLNPVEACDMSVGIFLIRKSPRVTQQAWVEERRASLNDHLEFKKYFELEKAGNHCISRHFHQLQLFPQTEIVINAEFYSSPHLQSTILLNGILNFTTDFLRRILTAGILRTLFHKSQNIFQGSWFPFPGRFPSKSRFVSKKFSKTLFIEILNEFVVRRRSTFSTDWASIKSCWRHMKNAFPSIGNSGMGERIINNWTWHKYYLRWCCHPPKRRAKHYPASRSHLKRYHYGILTRKSLKLTEK